jgi:drug/metabolite transporter (DMT)-like permease
MAGSAFIILSASVSYLCIALSKGVSLPESALGVTATLAIAFFSTVVAFWSFFAGLGRIGAAKASLVSTLEPLVTVISAVLFLGEKLTLSIVAGGFFDSHRVGDLSPAFKGCRQHAAIPDSNR